MALPPRVFFTLHEASARWGCNLADIAGWADEGRFHILTGMPTVRCGDEIVAGKVILSPMEVLPLFRRCGTGPSEGIVRRIQPVTRDDWLLITDPAEGVPVTVADMLIPAEEVHAFEEENGIVRHVQTGPGASRGYDWEGMTTALLMRLYTQGLPDTQAELVAEMQDWFSEQTNGQKMPDSRSIRRRVTPIWRALGKEGFK